MASAGQLFLLLLLSSLFVSTVSVPPQSANQIQIQELTPQKINKVKEGLKATGMFLLASVDLILTAALPFLGVIPIHGTLIAASVNLALLPLSVLNKRAAEKQLLNTIISEFENLNSKLDQYRVEQKWDTWASGAYHKPEVDINIAWQKYKTLVHALQLAKNEQEQQKHQEDFISSYSQYEPATKKLHELLKAKGTSFVTNLGDLLAEHLKCHEKDLRQYTVFIDQLIYKGNMMNQFYYKLKGIESEARVNEEADIAYNAGSVMFQVQKACISSSMDYIKKDVEALIDKAKPRSQLAHEVLLFLRKTYDRYDWMVVAFITKNSKHKIVETLNKHVLTGFTVVSKGEVSVAVARQVTGTHTKVAEVRKAIESCLKNVPVLCYKVAQKLSECKQTVENMPLSQTYSALHAYTKKAHASTNAQEEVFADPEEASPTTPYIYTGKCEESPGVKGGKFVILIKSDEEMMNKDPCSKMTCGGNQRGSCVRLPDLFLAMCECKTPYYGQQCERSLDDYKRDLQNYNGIIVIDNRKRRQPRV